MSGIFVAARANRPRRVALGNRTARDVSMGTPSGARQSCAGIGSACNRTPVESAADRLDHFLLCEVPPLCAGNGRSAMFGFFRLFRESRTLLKSVQAAKSIRGDLALPRACPRPSPNRKKWCAAPPLIR